MIFFSYTAHRVINILRYEVRELSSNLTIVRNNITLIREKIAHILYIVQEFYSNTNWIELHGSTIYEDFGECCYQLCEYSRTLFWEKNATLL